jgi:outer membrane protein OmpA-like peptidoglycan-associated protein
VTSARALLAAGVLALVTAAAPVSAGAAGSQEDGDARVVTWEPRVVDLSIRVAATDDTELSVETPEERTLTLASDVLFDFDRSDLNAEARRRIDALAEELGELGGRTVTIEGHTDDQGDPAYNQRLSEARAEAVRARLAVELGDGFTLEAAGYGETRPVAPNQKEDGSDDPEARARNRRVVISYPTD